jgi:tRNA-specific 2-thiouridylase
MATGHYARIQSTENGPVLLKGLDAKKDQSYFLALLTREMLSRVIFPLGEHTKDYARSLLEREGIHGYQSDESQELCFVPNGDYKAFLAHMGLVSLPGSIVDVSGKKLGEHSGIEHFTIGQRKGLGVSAPYPLYVVGIDPEKRMVVVGPRKDTFVNRLEANRMSYLQGSPPSAGQRFHAKVRSTSKPELCTIVKSAIDSVEIEFEQKQSGVALGQAVVLYSDERVVGGGWIERAWLSRQNA